MLSRRLNGMNPSPRVIPETGRLSVRLAKMMVDKTLKLHVALSSVQTVVSWSCETRSKTMGKRTLGSRKTPGLDVSQSSSFRCSFQVFRRA